MSTSCKFHQILMTAGSATASSTVLGPAILSQIHELAVYVVFSAGTTAGQVLIEGAPRTDYTGTWSTLGTVNWATADTCHQVAITGVHLAVRARISTTVAGGTVDVIAIGN